MEFSAKQIAAFLNGEIKGNSDVTVNNFSKIEEGKPGTLSFLANPKYSEFLYTTASSIVLVNKTFEPEKSVTATLIKVDDAYQAIAKLLTLYQQSKPRKSGIDPKAVISSSATVGDNCYIGPNAFIGDNVVIGNNTVIYPSVVIDDNAKIGNDCTIYGNVSVYHSCVIGNRVTIHAGVVIGADGFGFAPSAELYQKIPQIGNVLIEDDVEIGANTTIDRATLGSTIIRKGVKLDNMIQIGHNVEVGENTVIAAQVGIAGSTKIGARNMIGGQVGFAGHITIANDVKIAAKSGIANDVKEEGVILMGAPAIDAGQTRRIWMVYKQLPEMYRQINRLEKELATLKNNIQKTNDE